SGKHRLRFLVHRRLPEWLELFCGRCPLWSSRRSTSPHRQREAWRERHGRIGPKPRGGEERIGAGLLSDAGEQPRALAEPCTVRSDEVEAVVAISEEE